MRKIIAAASSLVVATTAVITMRPQAPSVSAGVLPVLDFSHSAFVDGIEDGLTRLVVEVDPSAFTVGLARASEAEGSTPGATSGSPTDGLGLGDQDREAIEALDGAGLDPRLADGTRLGTGDGDAAEAVTAPIEPVTAEPAPPVGQLVDLGVAGVREARWIAPTLLSVVGTFEPGVVAALPGVAVATEDQLLGLTASDPHYDLLWGLENIGQPIQGRRGTAGADLRWPRATAVATGQGIVVAIIDSGVELDHPDLVHAAWRNPGEVCGNGRDDDANGYVDDCQGWDFVRNDATPNDADADNGHGTHVAGTIAAAGGNGIGVVGVAPDAKIMSLKVQDGGSFPSSRAAEAIRYAADNGAHVINASWGSPAGQSASPAVASAIAYAEAHGVTVVAAAGNEGVDIDRNPSYPAALPNENIISVAATTNTDDLAGFSNRGMVSVDVAAPGDAIASTVPGGYGFASGTSMAAPHVTGVVALLMEHLGDTTPAAVRTHLLAGTRTVTSLIGRVATSGAVDAAVAVGVRDAGVSVTFAGLSGLRDDVDQQLHFALEAVGLPAEAQLVKRVTLGHLNGSQLVGVIGQPVLLDDDGDGAGSIETVTTTSALVPVSDQVLAPDELSAIEQDAWRTSMTFRLPAGTYALLVELVDAQTLATFGSPQAGLFEVASSQSPPPAVPAPVAPEPIVPMPAPPAVGVPNPVAPTPALPSPSLPTPGASEPVTPAPVASPAPSTPVTPEPSQPSQPSQPTQPAPTPSPAQSAPTPPPAQSAPTTPPAPPAQPAPTTPPASPSPAPSPAAPGSAPAPVATSSPTPAPTPAPTPITAPVAASPEPSGPESEAGAPVDGDPRVWPHQGPVSGNAIVKVAYEGLPDDAVVWFGESRSVTHLRTGWMLLVRTPAHPAGRVDVKVTSASHPDLVFPDAYRFVPDRPTGGNGKDVSNPQPPAPPVEAPPSAPGVPPTTGTPPTAGNTPPPTTGTPPAPPATSVPGLPDAGLLRGTIGSPFLAANGLTVDPFERDEPLRRLPPSAFAGRLCRAPRCPAVVL